MYLRLKAKTIGGNHYYAIKNIDIIPSLQQRARFSRKGEASLKGGGRVWIINPQTFPAAYRNMGQTPKTRRRGEWDEIMRNGVPRRLVDWFAMTN